MDRPICKSCQSRLTNRRERRGFFERVLMFKLGFFPWECTLCHKVRWSRERGTRVPRRNPSS